MFKHIICATDASQDADRALDYAAQIAEDNGGELHIVHVIEKLVAGKVAGQNADLFEHDHDAKFRRQVRQAQRPRDQGHPAHPVCEDGRGRKLRRQPRQRQ